LAGLFFKQVRIDYVSRITDMTLYFQDGAITLTAVYATASGRCPLARGTHVMHSTFVFLVIVDTVLTLETWKRRLC